MAPRYEICVGLEKGHKTTKNALKAKPCKTKGKLTKHNKFVRDLVSVKEIHLIVQIYPKHGICTRSKEWSFCGRGKRRGLRRSIG